MMFEPIKPIEKAESSEQKQVRIQNEEMDLFGTPAKVPEPVVDQAVYNGSPVQVDEHGDVVEEAPMQIEQPVAPVVQQVVH
jgi:hypothetical protein